jgi:hypothetical protein
MYVCMCVRASVCVFLLEWIFLPIHRGFPTSVSVERVVVYFLISSSFCFFVVVSVLEPLPLSNCEGMPNGG